MILRFILMLSALACSSRATPLKGPAPTKAAPAPVVGKSPGQPPSLETAMAAYDAKHWDMCAEQFAAIAKMTSQLSQSNAIYSAACCYALGGRTDLAFAALDASIAAGLHDVENVMRDPDLVNLRGDPRWTAMFTALKNAATARAKLVMIPQLRLELLALVKEDLAARSALIERSKHDDKADTQPVVAIDEKTSEAMRRAISKYGWPGKRVVDEDGAHAAFLLVEHSTDLVLQKDALARMKPMVEAGEVTMIDYAYLEDRIAIREHRKQRYGTQFEGNEPFPIEDEANVDARRKAIGLGTMADYKRGIFQMYGPQSTTKSPKN